MFEKVTRAKSKARIALIGPSGSGKTLSALYLAYGLTGDWSKIALIDTEHERGRFYAERDDLDTGAFLYASLTPPYSPDRYKVLVQEAAQLVGENGVIIVDSFSHAWDNEGGVLDIKSEIAKQKGKTDYTAWDEAGKIQNSLVNTILSVNCHTLITMRTKMAYAMELNEKGKNVPVKIGLAPVQRESTEYEFDICFQIAQNHVASISKDTTFLDGWSGIITAELGQQLNKFLSQGANLMRCTDCRSVIMGYKGKTKSQTAEEVAEGDIKKFGRKLCAACILKHTRAEKEKQDAAQTVSA